MKLLGQGELSIKLDITAYAATAGAVRIIEAAGGKVTLTKKVEAAVEG